VFHLMSFFSPVSADAVLVHAPLLPVPFREWLRDRGLRLIEVADDEFETMACNVLALEPGRCLMLDGNPRTRERLEAAGVEVLVYGGEEISRKGEGGPTCLTRPLLRQR
jgi:N-dimethylarginine dimethylaminohydrolase